MKFSIIIPAYKSSFLYEAVKSVVSQTYDLWELIVVDDCSPEDLQSVIAPFLTDSRIHYYRNEKNYGAIDVVDNWNKCLSYCTGEYVICMGDDDRLNSNCIQEYKLLIDKYPGLNVYHTRTEIINENGEIINLQEPRPEWESALSLIWNRWSHRNKQYIGDFCYRSEWLKQGGGYIKLPLAWGTDDMTAAKAAQEKGIANTQHFCFQYRENSMTITCHSDNAKEKILATIAQHHWFSDLLATLASQELRDDDKKYLATIGMPRYQFFYTSFSNDCVKYIKGNPLRLLWCYRQLRDFHYTKMTFLKWYFKSIIA